MEKVVKEVLITNDREFEVVKLEALTPSGKQVIHSLREPFKNQVVERFFSEWVEQADGSYTYPIAIDEKTGNIISARVERVTISAKQDFEAKGKGNTKKENVINLF